MKPFSQACENNKEPILTILRGVFADRRRLLEIGSGTGQHAVHFASQLPHLHWQTSDLAENHPAINAWIDDFPAANLARPVALDVTAADWPAGPFDAFFSANTCHIMPWPAVQAMFAGIARVAASPAMLVLYGPFNYDGRFTSDSNARFDHYLKERAPHQGIRDSEAIIELAEGAGLRLAEDHPMPANNRLLVFASAVGRRSWRISPANSSRGGGPLTVVADPYIMRDESDESRIVGLPAGSSALCHSTKAPKGSVGGVCRAGARQKKSRYRIQVRSR